MVFSKIKIKKPKDGRCIVNLGCAAKMHPEMVNVDFSMLAGLSRYKKLLWILYKSGVLTQERYIDLRQYDKDIIVWNLKKGIPFSDGTFDVVYHSHIFEHLERDFAPLFLKECMRVLKKGGILRVVVPDLFILIQRYMDSIQKIENGHQESFSEHQKATHDIFDQMARSEPVMTENAKQRPFIGFLGRFIRGDTEARGELHRWMYDKYSLEALLKEAGFKNVQAASCNTSRIHGWTDYGLETNPDGSEFHPYSLYMEAEK